ncbi:unnamed protein product [Cyclocybe aegerita]|uniref:Extracellular serine-rich protein n=1 Tax=Cyclocybe aegerita TaxID=1973307 RepID=A0A8S0VTQ9_CYCAE|nr:unnamed protein product [Cyclocybe aegerita]
MLVSVALSALSLVSLVSAQTVVEVGAAPGSQGGIFQFIPPTVTATNGTVVTFRFSGAPGNHTVTQSTFAAPCDPVDGGFDSGWVYVPNADAVTDEVPEFNLTITNDQAPIWFYCKQLTGRHCQQGMVGAINPPASGNTYEAFRTNAASVDRDSGQDQGGLVGIGASASAAVGPLPSGVQLVAPTETATSPPDPTTSDDGADPSPTTDAAAGVVVPSLLVMIASLLGFVVV